MKIWAELPQEPIGQRCSETTFSETTFRIYNIFTY